MNDIEVDPPLTEDQQLLMAFLDDEMSPQDRQQFETRLAKEPALAAEAASLKSVNDLTACLSLAEPSDHEVQRFWSSFYNRGEWQLGWVLLITGLAVLCGYGIYLLVVGDWAPPIVKAAGIAALIGGCILFWNTLRLKMRTSHFDRYRGVLR